MQKQGKKTKYFIKLASALCIDAFTVFTVLFFSPLEVFYYNRNALTFSPNNAAVMMLLICLAVTVISDVTVSFLPEKVFCILNALCFSCGLCAYLQELLMNGSMGTLTGEQENYSVALIIVNVAVWVAIFAMVLIAVNVFAGKGKVMVVLALISCAVTVMQLVGFISVLANNDTDVSINSNYVSADGQFELSENDNLVYFVIDSCDSGTVKTALEKNPDIFKNLNGFTYFPNCVSSYSRTYPSVPYLLTKTDCRFDLPYTEYIETAYKQGHFLDDIHALGTDIRLYTEETYISPEMTGIVDNLKKQDDKSFVSLSPVGLLKECAAISGYRILPYAVKGKLKYTAADINITVRGLSSKRGIVEDDSAFYDAVKQTRLSLNKNYSSAFRFYHFWGVHPGFEIDENAKKSIKNDSLQSADAFAGCIKIIDEYIAQMKKLGIYDNSTIIITADHGLSNPSGDLSLIGDAACLMLVKPKNADSTKPVATSTAPVCHEDLFGTCLSALGTENFKDYNAGIFSIKEDENRTRVYNHTALISDNDGEIALVQYDVTGDAGNLKNYKRNGKVWDINYSESAVSNHRYSEFAK